MNIVLPKPSRGYVFSRLFVVELNDFDVERLLPSLFYLIVTRGRRRGKRVNDPAAFDDYFAKLVAHQRLQGFEDPGARRVLQKWISSAVLRVGAAGRGKQRQQIEYVLPITLLAYKPGFPAEIRRQRNVHVFLYRILMDALEGAGGPSTGQQLMDLFSDAFGQGTRLGGAPTYNGAYDEATPLDIHTLLALSYLDGLQPTPVAAKESFELTEPALPGVAKSLSRDLLRYIAAYRARLPALALVQGLAALINFELCVYTLKLMYATNHLVERDSVPTAFQDQLGQSPPDLYVDFTLERGSVSDDLARACVDRDLEEIGRFFPSALRLRTLDRFVGLMPQLHTRLKNLPTPAYLSALHSFRDEADVVARARMEVEAIRHESFEQAESAAEHDDLEQYFSTVAMQSASGPLTAALECLAQPQRKKAVESYIQWYWSVAGLRKTYGILAGNTHGRRNWRYAMSDDLLATLVHLALVEDPFQDIRRVSIRPRMRLQEFLEFLRLRFGILVDQPPPFLDDAGSRAAASQNLLGLKRRLRHMGLFTALSDDFTAQYIHAPSLQEVAV